MKKIHILTNGCLRRRLDSSKLAKYFEMNNCIVINKIQNADFILLVTCAYKKLKESESFKLMSLLSRYKGELIVLGCLPEIAPNKLKATFNGKSLSTKNLNQIDGFFHGFRIKFSEVEDANKIYPSHYPILAIIRDSIFQLRLSNLSFRKIRIFFYRKIKSLNYKIKSISMNSKSRKSVGFVTDHEIKRDKNTGYLRISNGCLGKCTYCSVQKAVGKLRSKPLVVCLDEYKKLLEIGYTNIVIIADDIGSFGLDINSSFPELLQKMTDLDKDKNVNWYLHGLNPRWAYKHKSRLINVIKSGKIKAMTCPIQSGSDRILGLMNRYDNSQKIIDTLLEFREANKNMNIYTHIIIGFPSETDQDLKNTLNLIKRVRFEEVLLFKYFDSEGLDKNRDNKVDDRIKRNRLQKVINFLKNENISCWYNHIDINVSN